MIPLVCCGTADPLGVCDVKDQIGLSTEANSPAPISRYQPRIPEAARTYCTRRANFAQGRRPSIVDNWSGILISHRVINRALMGVLVSKII